MKVAFDLSPLHSGHQYRGIGFYTKRLLDALKIVAKKEKVQLQLIKNSQKIHFLSADLIHYPYFSPYFLSLPVKPLLPSVVTIHDLIPVKYFQHFPAGLRGRWRWQQQKRRLPKMAAVLTDSQIWRQQISEMTGYFLDKIYSVPLAAGPEFRKIRFKIQETRFKRQDLRFKIAKKFVLYVGDVNWNKNIPGLLRGFAGFAKNQPDFQLVLVGKAFRQEDLPETKEIIQLINSLNLNDQVIRLGFVETKDLVKIYNLASVYCQPSFDEGFGLPVLEAMACGCPVVAAKAGSLPEICGQAAVMVDPAKDGEIATGISRALKEKTKLIKRGFKQASRFSWRQTARQTIEVYRKILHE